MNKVWAIIVAAGEGSRLGLPKSHVVLKGKTILERCLETFETHPGITDIVLVLRAEKLKDPRVGSGSKVKGIALGGKRRQDSVLAGFQKIPPSSETLVLVHDVARPLVSADLIDRVINAAAKFGTAVPVVPVSDTLKKVVGDRISSTVDRTGIFQVQTPQGFVYDVLQRAFDRALERGELYTDEASLVEELGTDVFTVPGDPRNIKITFPHDLKLAEAFIED
jgi:2-C-methyl-D-erythritol 4-phosphate cytidylyltransferase